MQNAGDAKIHFHNFRSWFFLVTINPSKDVIPGYYGFQFVKPNGPITRNDLCKQQIIDIETDLIWVVLPDVGLKTGITGYVVI